MLLRTLCLFALLLSPHLSALGADDVPRPNVLFIAIDDLNDWVGFLNGHPQAQTPNMDRLAQRGIVFTNAHCASPACNPSRAAVFSGRMPWQTGVWSNEHKKLFQLQPKIHVLPDSFRDAGYLTLGTGKLMHSGAADNKRLFQRHFDVEQRWSPLTLQKVRYTLDELPTKGSDHPKHVVEFNNQSIQLPLNRMPSDRNPDKPDGESFDWGPFDVPDSAMGDSQITDWAIEQLKTNSDAARPFFLGIGYYRPHIPLYAPVQYFKRFAGQQMQLPPVHENDLDDLSETGRRWALEADTAGLHSTVVKHQQWQAAVKAYLACATFVDAQIGRLLKALDASGSAGNTVIVLWSDHGWHLGEKQHWGKWTGWERSTRVPLIIVPPKRQSQGLAEPGARCDTPVSLIDLFPTLVELCDLEAPQGLDGKSLVPLLRQPEGQPNRVAVTTFDPGNVSVRNRNWRLIRYSDGSQELYDLKSDPHEWSNLAGDSRYQKQMQELGQAIPARAFTRR